MSEHRRNTPIEEMARQAWSSALATEVGGGDDFFELGGDSMAAVSIVTEVGAQLACELDITVLYANSVLKDFVNAVVVLARADGGPSTTAGSDPAER